MPQYPKEVREALCAAQSALGERALGMDVDPGWIAEIQYMINEIDKYRPIGPDGKHGEKHRFGCGCEGHVCGWSIQFDPTWYYDSREH